MISRTRIAALSLSAAGLVGIAGWETYRGDAYYATQHERDKGISTIGWGSTDGVRPGDRTTPDKALVRLLATAEKFQDEMRDCIGDDVEMTQGAWDAISSLAFNIGTTAFCKSTLVKKLKAGEEFCSEILRWNRQGGVELAGLTRRREAEYRTCIGNG